MTNNSAPPFVAIELKNTHHVLGLLSRDADTGGGGDLSLLAPRTLSVRAPVMDPAPNPTVAPFELHVPQSLLQATAVTGATWEQRNNAFSKPQNCLLANGAVTPMPSGVTAPTLTFAASAAGMVTEFDVILASAVGAELAYTVIIEEAKPAPDTEPFMRTTESKIAAGDNGQINVMIRAAAGSSSPPNPIPANTWVYVLVAVPGYPLVLKTVQTPP
jgi:hypothetical protein